ncbi:hypothetical protein Vadar_013919 [Vaccinium darrowii]|uniref:Uncharacterized protein n=1 Tax=Vaccinium darrowii TaxID=229202 RepID=A0ACB7X140_9ERIC|nr:hypothetical protein Vadar_013919 [Vaccinium darrowii]
MVVESKSFLLQGITTYEYVVVMRAQSEPPGPSVVGEDRHSLPSSPRSSAMPDISGKSSVKWACNMDHQVIGPSNLTAHEKEEEEKEEGEEEEEEWSEQELEATTLRNGNKGKATIKVKDDVNVFEYVMVTQPRTPYFVTKLRQKKRTQLLVPTNVIKEHRLELPENLIFLDENGKAWRLKGVWSGAAERTSQGSPLKAKQGSQGEENSSKQSKAVCDHSLLDCFKVDMQPIGEPAFVSIDEKLSLLYCSPSACCIFKVPNQLRKVNEKAYEPEIIAIGPYHRGVKLEKVEGGTLLDIKFQDGVWYGVLQIPPFTIEDRTESFFRNLIAYEQYCLDNQPCYMTDYLTLMNSLIESPKDVAILSHIGIIDNWIGDDEVVSKMFNKIGDAFMVQRDQFYYADILNKANICCQKPWNRRMAKLNQNFLNSPWAPISVLAALVLLLLAFKKTFFAVFPRS